MFYLGYQKQALIQFKAGGGTGLSGLRVPIDNSS